LSFRPIGGKAFRMSEGRDKNMSREERLAAKLRENLRRRKAQSRQMSRETSESGAERLPNKRDDS